MTHERILKLFKVTDRLREKIIKEIISTFDLTKSEQLNVFRVSFYNSAKEENDRIFELLVIALDWKSAGLKSNKENLRGKVIVNKSVLDLLSEKALNKEKILFAGSRLKMSEKMAL